MTKFVIPTLLLTVLGLLAGCDRRNKGPAYGQQQEFRRQITDSIPVKQWGYSVSDIRVSDDAEKVLVVFASSGGPPAEVVLEHDGFRRYKGTFSSAERLAAAIAAQEAASAAYNSNLLARMHAGRVISDRPSFNPGSFMSNCSAPIVVTLADR
jgi:hypothetical protein